MSGDKTRLIIDGETAAGVHIKVEQRPGIIGGPYEQPLSIWIGGEETKLTDRPSLYRDGGTLKMPTERGLIVRHSPWKYPEGYATLDGEEIQ